MSKPVNTTPPAKSADAGTISHGSALVASFVVFGKLVSMKNRRRMLKSQRTGKLFPAKSSDAERYVRDFILQVPLGARNLALGSLKEPLSARLTVYHVDMRSDLDCSLVYDCLQLAGVISNDRFIREHYEFAFIDSKNPRVEIEIRELRLHLF